MASLAKQILAGSIKDVQATLSLSPNIVNDIDEYGFTPLTQAAITGNQAIAEYLLTHAADPNLPDLTGRSALHWAVDNQNLPLVELLLHHKANPNAYTRGGEPALVIPLLRQQEELKNVLVAAGAKISFAQDFINSKLLGHRFELSGPVDILNDKDQFIEIECEGFFVEFSLSTIQFSLEQYKNNFAARHLRHYFSSLEHIQGAFQIAGHILRLQQYQTPENVRVKALEQIIRNPLLLLPIAYSGHAISFVRFGNYWARCDRGAQGRKEGTVILYRIHKPEAMTVNFLKNLLFQRQTETYVHETIHEVLGLERLTTLDLSPQITGNCSWANMEASMPVMLLFRATLEQENVITDPAQQKEVLFFYHEWEIWDRDRALEECIQHFFAASPARKATHAALLGNILFNRCQFNAPHDLVSAEKILRVLTQPDYRYVLDSYIATYSKRLGHPRGYNLMQILRYFDVAVNS